MASKYVYHWNRIFGALALVAVLLGVGGYGIASLFVSERDASGLAQPDPSRTARAVTAEAAVPRSPEPAPSTVERSSTVDTAPASRSSDGTTGQESVSAQASDPELESVGNQTQVALEPSESNPSASAEGGSWQVAHPPVVAESGADRLEPGGLETGSLAVGGAFSDRGERASEPASLPIAAVPTLDPGLSTHAAAPLLASVALEPDRGAAPGGIAGQAPALAEHHDPVQPAPRAVLEAGETTVYSPAVQRFSLAQAIENREPVADLRGVSFDDNGLATAYAFSEVEGLMGSTLYYHWLHEGKQLAAVRIRVADERWRSHSSKYINEAKTGVWTVQLRDAEGELLAQADFTLRPQGSSGGR